ncbi:FemAB family PEP-CTERM system-associated protein [Altererythrobacter arenosus]|uniref:FemAB family PEP-CTERM system-associated protein n=2 Tax=Altererythrobacter arenosus TaxID=3032592 RepID=A0ABY8FVQ1_9SPHN|nr:FemAB family XrtA/PEP-CTERM system-associated protein [Altererythrobacter sp. CAU 1644]WFL79093.1 FemAB family PEP-CTERM system-associated protein [Altererythrobacter sp. CAU 1644]
MPLNPSATRYAVADLRAPGEAARIEGFVRDMEGTLFHRPLWLEAVERGTGQRATGIVAERMGAVVGWLPLTEIHSPLFGRALASSGFAVGGGTLADSTAATEGLCRAAEELAVRASCPSVEIRGGAIPSDWERWNDRHAGFEADLADDDEAQLLFVPRKQRADIRKSLDSDLTVSVGTNEQQRAAHYAIYAESVRNLGTPVFPRGLFDAMLNAFDDSADILTVLHGDEPVASVLNFYHRGSVMPYWGGGVYAARALKANERMYYELMLHARRKGMSCFDFGRSKTGSGPYRYKKNWGFEPQPMTYGGWSADPAKARNIDPTDASYSAKIELWKKLPLPLANRIGPLIAKGLG